VRYVVAQGVFIRNLTLERMAMEENLVQFGKLSKADLWRFWKHEALNKLPDEIRSDARENPNLCGYNIQL
jgi:hypothetical protein